MNDPDLANRTAQAGSALFNEICQALADSRGVHLETALAAAGFLTGASMLQNCGIDLARFEPGAPVLVDKINELGPMVLDSIFTLAERGGLPADPPAATIPEAHLPHKSFEQLLPLVRPAFERVCAQMTIPTEMRPFVAARAAAQLMVAGRDQLPAGVAKAIVAEAIVKAAKTAPRLE